MHQARKTSKLYNKSVAGFENSFTANEQMLYFSFLFNILYSQTSRTSITNGRPLLLWRSGMIRFEWYLIFIFWVRRMIKTCKYNLSVSFRWGERQKNMEHNLNGIWSIYLDKDQIERWKTWKHNFISLDRRWETTASHKFPNYLNFSFFILKNLFFIDQKYYFEWKMDIVR